MKGLKQLAFQGIQSRSGIFHQGFFAWHGAPPGIRMSPPVGGYTERSRNLGLSLRKVQGYEKREDAG